MNVLVIGGGASGIISSIVAASNGANVTILERNNTLGKKLSLTGNGRCNFWNKEQSLDKYHSSNIEEFKTIWNLKKDEILPFFHNLGIIEKEINGYYYPFSNQALNIVKILENKLHKLNVTIKYNEFVTKIIYKDKFKVYTSNNIYTADKVIIATGGASFPKTGSDGNMYKVLKDMGHDIIDVLPSLVQVVGKDSFYKYWEGVRSFGKLSLMEDKKIIKEEIGEIQFTNYGLSGVCTFNLSGLIAKGLKKNKEEIILIDLVPWFKGSSKEFLNWLDNEEKLLSNYSLLEILEGFLNIKLIKVIFKLANIKDDTTWSNAPKEKIVKLLKNFPFKVKETLSFDKAQVSSGGVSLKNVNMKTMESKIVPNLYLTGEILDIDGDCGGYNLGIAWITGITAGESVSK